MRRCLGSGGFGSVYEALDRKRNAVVALKMLRDPGGGRSHQIKQEFRSLSGITHPNLVTLYELVSEGDPWFFTMELVEGSDFLEFVGGHRTDRGSFTLPTPEEPLLATEFQGEEALATEGPGDADGTLTEAPLRTEHERFRPRSGPPEAPRGLPPLLPGRLAGALRQLVAGLMALHQAGKVHRDIKPSNVLCTPEGRVVILDFGIAQDLSEGTAVQDIAGTPCYMAPEQAIEKELSPAADWYSVGVLLYQALTGAVPFSGSGAQVIQQKALLDAPPLSAYRGDVPPALGALCMRLLARRPAERPGGEEILAILAAFEETPGEAPAPRAGATPFVGRDGHLSALFDAFRESREGKTSVVLCRGGSGAGKSTLCRRFLRDLTQHDERVVVLASRCYEHEDVPFKALDGVIDALGRFLQRRPADEVRAVLPRDTFALARLFPVLLQIPEVKDAPQRPIADDLRVRQAAFGALRELLLRLAQRRPLVLFIDDLQWGDPDGVALLLEVLRPPDPPPLLLLVSYRSEEEASSAALLALRQGLLGELGRGVEAHDLLVGGLSEEEAQSLARALLPEATQRRAAAIAAEAQGNAFFVVELSRHATSAPLEGEGVDLDSVLRARVARLPASARDLLQAVAVAGQPLPRSVAALATYGASLETDEPQALAQLFAERLIRVRHARDGLRGGLREELLPYHDRVREAVVAGLEAAPLAGLHLRLARTLEASGQAEPEQLVFHLLRGGDLAAAARYAAQASGQAAQALAYHQAARLCRAAIATGKLSGDELRAVEVRLADALAGAGRPREAADAYLALVDREPPALALQRRRQAARQLFAGGYLAEGHQVLAQLLAAARLRLPGTPLGLVLTMMSFRALIGARGRGFRERTEAEIPPEDLLRIDTCDAVGAAAATDPLLSSVFRLEALWYSLRAGEPHRIARALANEALLLFAYGVPRATIDRSLAQATALATRLRDPYAAGNALGVAGHIANLEGRWEESRSFFTRAAEIFRNECVEVTPEIDFFETLIVYNLRWQGELGELGERVPPLLKEFHERGNQSQAVITRLIAAFLLPLREDDAGRADEVVLAASRCLEGQPFNLQHIFALEAALMILLYRGDHEGAWRLLSEKRGAIVASGQLRMEFFEVVWLNLGALVALAAGQPPRPAELDAAKMARCRPLFAAPMALLVRALACRRQGATPQAAAFARAAENAFVGCGMGLHGASARLRRGRWLGGDEGEALVAEARAWMQARGVRNPDRMASMLAPDVSP